MKNTQQPRCVIGVRGQTPTPDYPINRWFDAFKQQPKPLTKLARLTGRAISSVSRTLKILGKCNVVEMQDTKNMLCPTVIHQAFLVVVNNEK